MPEHRHGHAGHVPRGGVLALGGQARAVDEVGVRHAQLRRPGVHLIHAQLLGAVHQLRQRHRSVVGRADDHALEQHIHRLHLAGVQQHLGAAHARGLFRDGHALIHGDAALFDGLQRQKDRHHLGDRRHRPGRIGVHLEQNLAALRLQQQHGGAVQVHGRGLQQRRLGQFRKSVRDRGRSSRVRLRRGVQVELRCVAASRDHAQQQHKRKHSLHGDSSPRLQAVLSCARFGGNMMPRDWISAAGRCRGWFMRRGRAFP